MTALGRAHLAALALGLVLSAGVAPEARASCFEAPAPGVDWKGCILDDTVFGTVDLRGARLRAGRFLGSDFTGTDLSKSDSRRAKFVGAILVNVNFDGARLGKADLTKADLTGATLRHADLRRAKLFRAILRNADMTGARLDGADLLQADLSGALWVDGKTRCAEGSIGQCKLRASPSTADSSS